MSTAKEILDRALFIDMHLDLPEDLYEKHKIGRKHVLTEEYLDTFKAGGVDLICGALCMQEANLPEKALHRALGEVETLYDEIETSGGAYMLCRNTADILKAKELGKVGIMLTFEGVEPLMGDVRLLHIFYELGVRIMSLCWSRSNWAADGVRFHSDESGYGVTRAGVELIHYAEELGITLDVSHMDNKGFWDLSRVTTKPFVATHSCAYSLSPSPRNLKDDQLDEMAKRGGVVGMNGVTMMVNYCNQKAATLDYMVDHMVYIKNRMGISGLALGLDQYERMLNASPVDTGDIIKTHEGMPALIDMMMQKGFTEDEILAVLGGNVLRVLKQTIDK